MPIRSVSDALYTGIAWFPFLAVLVAAGTLLMMGLVELEVRSTGTEFFLTNDSSVNKWNADAIREHREVMREFGAR